MLGLAVVVSRRRAFLLVEHCPAVVCLERHGPSGQVVCGCTAGEGGYRPLGADEQMNAYGSTLAQDVLNVVEHPLLQFAVLLAIVVVVSQYRLCLVDNKKARVHVALEAVRRDASDSPTHVVSDRLDQCVDGIQGGCVLDPLRFALVRFDEI